jgi:ribonuclease R
MDISKILEKKGVRKLTGLISITSFGTGYVTVGELEEDVQIQPQFLNKALHNDEVEISLFPQVKGEKLSGEVVDIVRRAKMEFVGTIQKKKGTNFAFVIPDDKRMYLDIFISASETKKVQNNYKVLVRIKDWKDARKNPNGEILKVIGKKGDNNVEMESIVLEKGFEVGFPQAVEREANMLEKTAKPISPAEIAKRRDFRGVLTFTIDPYDAKDFDDAISYKKISEDLFEVGMHIADVSHYVREGSHLDKEALHRGVSIYLVDRTIPMLPEVLSNDICSLKQKEDKLTFAAVLTITRSGEIKNRWIGRTIINSNRRFVYEDAQEILDKKDGLYYQELNDLNVLAKIFKQKRMDSGALDFEKDEVKFQLDAKGKPLSVTAKSRTDIHKLVEEFMILANREVASYLSDDIKKISKGSSIYRIHDLPKQQSMDELLAFVRRLGHQVKMKGEKISSKELNDLFEKIKGSPEESLIKTAAMRSMAKAIYSTHNIGHYGLALANYTHFTSPIRRYADLLVHRVLEKHLKGGHLNEEKSAMYHELTAGLTVREIDATDAERTSIALKQTEYMLERIGEVYEGIISGITNWGIYVEENYTKANGMIKLKDLQDDYYVFDKASYSLMGTKTKKKYAVGDLVKIKVVGGDLENKTIDYQFV